MYNHKDGITLRKVNRSDLQDLYQLKQESWWGTHKSLIINQEDQERWFENIPSDQLFMLALQGEVRVGVAVYTDIDWLNRSLNISGSIFKTCRQATITKSAFAAGLDFAFEMLNARRVGAEVLATNRAAQQLELGYLGFVVEGVRRKAIYKCGQYIDSVVLGLLREEWESQDRIKKYGGVCNENFVITKPREFKASS